MNISGKMTFPWDVAKVAKALADPNALQDMAGQDVALTMLGNGRASFSFTKALGPFDLELPGEVSLHQPQSNRFSLSAFANHSLGGSAKADAEIVLSKDDVGMTEAAYTGTIEASGLAGRALAIRPDLARKVFSRALTRLWWVLQNRDDEARRSAQFIAARSASSD